MSRLLLSSTTGDAYTTEIVRQLYARLNKLLEDPVTDMKSLVCLLLEPPYAWMRFMFDVVTIDVPYVSSTLLSFCGLHGRALDVIVCAALHHVQTSKTLDDLYSHQSMFAELFRRHALLVGRDFLQICLAGAITDACKNDTDVNDDDIRTNTAHVIQLCESVLSRVCGMLYMCPVVMVKAFRECVVRMNPSQRYRSGAFLFWDSFVVVGLAKPHVYGIVQYKPSKRVLKGLAYACEVIRHAASGMVMDDSRMLSEAGTMLNDFICVKSNALKWATSPDGVDRTVSDVPVEPQPSNIYGQSISPMISSSSRAIGSCACVMPASLYGRQCAPVQHMKALIRQFNVDPTLSIGSTRCNWLPYWPWQWKGCNTLPTPAAIEKVLEYRDAGIKSNAKEKWFTGTVASAGTGIPTSSMLSTSASRIWNPLFTTPKTLIENLKYSYDDTPENFILLMMHPQTSGTLLSAILRAIVPQRDSVSVQQAGFESSFLQNLVNVYESRGNLCTLVMSAIKLDLFTSSMGKATELFKGSNLSCKLLKLAFDVCGISYARHILEPVLKWARSKNWGEVTNDDEIRAYTDGNLCRVTPAAAESAVSEIVEMIRECIEIASQSADIMPGALRELCACLASAVGVRDAPYVLIMVLFDRFFVPQLATLDDVLDRSIPELHASFVFVAKLLQRASRNQPLPIEGQEYFKIVNTRLVAWCQPILHGFATDLSKPPPPSIPIMPQTTPLVELMSVKKIMFTVKTMSSQVEEML